MGGLVSGSRRAVHVEVTESKWLVGGRLDGNGLVAENVAVRGLSLQKFPDGGKCGLCTLLSKWKLELAAWPRYMMPPLGGRTEVLVLVDATGR
jgi:hypothetical protein